VHGDLHPGNVMLTATGPLVIDWTNAASRGADRHVRRRSTAAARRSQGST
jgi:RIO-like serine/threonine protein kinase